MLAPPSALPLPSSKGGSEPGPSFRAGRAGLRRARVCSEPKKKNTSSSSLEARRGALYLCRCHGPALSRNRWSRARSRRASRARRTADGGQSALEMPLAQRARGGTRIRARFHGSAHQGWVAGQRSTLSSLSDAAQTAVSPSPSWCSQLTPMPDKVDGLDTRRALLRQLDVDAAARELRVVLIRHRHLELHERHAPRRLLV